MYLSCSRRALVKRLRGATDRPLLCGKSGARPNEVLESRIKRLLKQRLKHYRMADVTCSTTSRTPKETVAALVAKLNRWYEDDHR